MDNTWLEIIKVGGTAVITVIGTIVATSLNWFRGKKKDVADTDKVKAETAKEFADVGAITIENEIRLSKAAMEWAATFSVQLEKANALNEKRSAEIERLHGVIQTMRDEFDQRIDEINAILDLTREELTDERNKNRLLIDQLNSIVHDGGKSK